MPFLVFFQTVSVGCRGATDRQQTTDMIPKLPTDRYLLFLSVSYLYMVNLSLKSLFLEDGKIIET